MNKLSSYSIELKNRILDKRLKKLNDMFNLHNLENKQNFTELSNKQSEIFNILEEIKGYTKPSSVMVTGIHEVVVKIFSGIKIYLDPRDVAVAPHLALDGVWEKEITRAWVELVRPEDIIMDIGSNFGYYGALAAQRTDKKKSKIIYFEANPHLIPYIHKTLNVNWMNEQSVVENMAVSDKKGNLTLTVLNDYIGSSSLHSIEHMAKFLDNKMELAVNEKIKVKSISIDEYCKDNSMDKVDLIKMDIEGYEEIAYSGMRGIIDKSPETTLLIEFTKNSYKNPKNFYNELMNDFGNIYVINNDGLLVRPKNRTYEAVAGSSDDWIMLVFSKRKGLEKHTN